MAIPYNENYNQTVAFSDTCAQLALATNTNLAYTIPGLPTQKYQARISYTQGSNVFCCKNAAATVPGAGLLTQVQYLEFRPGADGSKRIVQGGDTLNFMTPDASAYVGVALAAIPS